MSEGSIPSPGTMFRNEPRIKIEDDFPKASSWENRIASEGLNVRPGYESPFQKNLHIYSDEGFADVEIFPKEKTIFVERIKNYSYEEEPLEGKGFAKKVISAILHIALGLGLDKIQCEISNPYALKAWLTAMSKYKTYKNSELIDVSNWNDERVGGEIFTTLLKS